MSLLPGSSCTCKLPCSHAAQSSIYYFWTHHDWNSFSIGCGGDGQQQHILVVTSNPQNWEVYLHKSEVRDGCTLIPSNSNNRPKGWILRPRALHSCALMFDTCAPESTKAATSCPSTTTGTLLTCPTNHTTWSGFRNGMGAIPFCPFLLTALTWVGFGLVSQRECFKLTVGYWRGVWLHSPGSPIPV